MTLLPDSLRDWNRKRFVDTLKHELRALPAGALPLHACTTQGGYVDDSALDATLLRVAQDERFVHADVGVFFTEIVICCGCGDDPMPIPGYGELRVSIDRRTAQAGFSVLAS